MPAARRSTRVCRDRFLDLWQAAHDGGLEHWVDGTVGTLAYLILTDQFPRNMHRGTAAGLCHRRRSARAAARKAVAAGWDMDAPEPERQFFYMPFEHSEDPADQDLCGAADLTERLPSDPEMALHARAHREIIAPLWPLSVPQRGLGPGQHAPEEAGLSGRRRLWRRGATRCRPSHAPDA